MKRIKPLLLFTAICSLSYAQQPLTIFEDTELKPPNTVWARIKTDSCVYVGGQSWDTYQGNPYVTKINGAGKIAWRWSTSTTGLVSTWALMACDSSVYAFAGDQFASSFSQLYKLKSSDGSVVWSKTLSNQIGRYNCVLDNYNDSTVAILSSGRFIQMRKSNGVILDDVNLPIHSLSSDNISTIDPYGYLYYGGSDTIYKFHNVVHDSVVWKQNYDYNPVRLEDPRGLYADSTHLYVAGEQSVSIGGPVGYPFLKIDPANGSVVYRTALTRGGYDLNEWIDRNGFIYGAAAHTTFGAVTTDIWCFKVEKQTGLLHWYLIEQVDSLPNIPYTGPSGGSGNDRSIALMSIDVDSHGDIYGTGHYAGEFTGTCFTFKADGDSGTLLWQHTIIDDSSRYDTEGGGRVAWVSNNRAYFIGMLKPDLPNFGPYDVITAIAECDTATGVVINKEYDGGTYKFASKVVDLQHMPNGDILSFVQLGRGIQIVRYDAQLNIIWEKKFYCVDYSANDVLTADRVAIADNGNIAFCGTLLPYLHFITNVQNPDSILYFQLDGAGNVISRTASNVNQQLSGTPIYVMDLIYDGTNAMLYYVDSNNIKCLEFSGGTLQYNFLTNNVLPTLHPRKIGVDLNAQYTLYTNITAAGTVLRKRDKTIAFDTAIDTLPALSIRTTLAHVDASRFIIAGKTGSGTMVAMYDWMLEDTLWTYTGPGSVHESYTHVIYDSATNSIYAACRLQQEELSFQRFNATTGQQLWASSFNAPIFDAKCNDLEYDAFNHRLIGVGVVQNGFNDWDALIWTFDSSGVALDTIISRMAAPANHTPSDPVARMSAATYNLPEATAALVINSQRVLVAATIEDTPVNTGVYFDLSPTGIHTVTHIHNPVNDISVYPNPFKTGINIRLANPGAYTQVMLYDLQGRMINKTNYTASDEEVHYFDLAQLQKGCYLLVIHDKEMHQIVRIIKD